MWLSVLLKTGISAYFGRYQHLMSRINQKISFAICEKIRKSFRGIM